jgi:hypothetical protein
MDILLIFVVAVLPEDKGAKIIVVVAAVCIIC